METGMKLVGTPQSLPPVPQVVVLNFPPPSRLQRRTNRVTESPDPWTAEGLLTSVLLLLGCLPCLFEFGSPLALGDLLAVLVVSFALMVFLLAEEAPFGLLVWTERTIKVIEIKKL